MEPSDPTVTERRRRVAVDGHVGPGEVARAGLGDPAPIVRITALGALDRLGQLQLADLAAGLADPEPSVRRRACELAAGRPGPDLIPFLDDRDPFVAEMAAWAIGERGSAAAVPALVTMAAQDSGHPDPLGREAAVAALGAIGDPAGLPAVLAALEDKPAIRRRAAVALAAFDGPEVEAALRRCLEDRDWQVRQVAEDLLAVD
ncbi:MAG TPA: HEAT repeat domain-containing protein [Acidimicrobiales bacterium]|jgi:HEAT repeat protein|nr:HEAT repeat domain-containing protein [Acidimicrobiales bacterium]